jgi:hypothetical protein
MTSEQAEMLIFADGKGDYYQIPRALFEQGRVPDDQKAQLERALSRDDTSGFAVDMFLKIDALSGVKLIGASKQVSGFSWGATNQGT